MSTEHGLEPGQRVQFAETPRRGVVVEVREDYVVVRWENGDTSRCWPAALHPVPARRT